MSFITYGEESCSLGPRSYHLKANPKNWEEKDCINNSRCIYIRYHGPVQKVRNCLIISAMSGWFRVNETRSMSAHRFPTLRTTRLSWADTFITGKMDILCTSVAAYCIPLDDTLIEFARTRKLSDHPANIRCHLLLLSQADRSDKYN